MIRKILILILSLFVLSCRPVTPKRSSPDQVLAQSEIAADRQQFEMVPKLDVLIVVDNSDSMKPHQEMLAQNIKVFVEKFARNAAIDFHIGVLSIGDSLSPGSATLYAKYPLGQLVPLRDPSSPEGDNSTPLMDAQGNRPPPFVTRDTPDLISVLEKTIILGENPGPEFEEMFSPVEAFFQAPNLNGPNAGFYRSDAHLLIVWITDANDGSLNYPADTFYTDMLNIKGGRRDLLHFYGILSPTNDPKCEFDPAGKPFKFNELMGYADGKILSLCSPTFGSELASFGDTLATKVGRQVIALRSVPDLTTLKVTFGSQTINPSVAPDFKPGWSYHINKNHDQNIVIDGNLDLKPEPGAKIKIDVTFINFNKFNFGHIQPLSLVTPAPVPVSSPVPAAPPTPATTAPAVSVPSP